MLPVRASNASCSICQHRRLVYGLHSVSEQRGHHSHQSRWRRKGAGWPLHHSIGAAHLPHDHQQHDDGHDHGHDHHNAPHSHSHAHSHSHRHYHTDSRTTQQHPVLQLIAKTRFFDLAGHMESKIAYSVMSVACFATALALPVLASYGVVPAALAATAANWALVGTFILSGVPQLAETITTVARGVVDTHVLMSLAVMGTFYLKMQQEGALLLLLFRVSHVLEERLTQRAQGNLARLFDSVPAQATVVDVEGDSSAPRTSSARQVAAAEVQLDQHVLVRPGEQVPLDGVIVHGTANVSLQHISGESAPVRLTEGQEVPAGGLSTDGMLVVRVTARTDDSTPARIARMAAEAQAAKPQLQRWLDDVGATWSKAVIAATAATMLLLPLLGVPLLGERGAVYRAMGVLTAGSPCALVLVPLAYVCAIAAITRRGIIVKSGGALDALADCSKLALDKTGTITSGSLTFTDGYTLKAPSGVSLHHSSNGNSYRSVSADQAAEVQQFSWQQQPSTDAADTGRNGSGNRQPTATAPTMAELLNDPAAANSLELRAVRYATALSGMSNHPVSRAMVGYTPQLARDVRVTRFEQVPGAGVQGMCQVHDSPPQWVRFGSLDWIKEFLPNASAVELLQQAVSGQSNKVSRATAFLTIHSASTASGSSSSSSNGSSGSSSSNGSSIGSSKAGADDAPELAMFCFEDVIQSGVPAAVASLRSGAWVHPPGRNGSAAGSAADAKEVVMLTGDNKHVARAVAGAVGIEDFRAALRPEQKLAYVQEASNRQQELLRQTPSGIASLFRRGSSSSTGGGGLMMVGDGINDAPALAAAQISVAIASTPSDMVAAAADVIILNGRGITNLPELFRIARRTQDIVRQNLALALLAVVFATVPTVAGVFPLWLAVTLHEGSTLLVALNSLRLLLESESEAAPHGAAAAHDAGIGTTVSSLRDVLQQGERDGNDEGVPAGAAQLDAAPAKGG